MTRGLSQEDIAAPFVMGDDLTFFTNEPHCTLLDRFKRTLKDVEYFDVLVGYFRTSGFYRLYESFEPIEKIRILVGINVDSKTLEIVNSFGEQTSIDFESHKTIKENYSNSLVNELEHSADTMDIETGIRKFVEFLKSEKIEIKAYPGGNIHAKVYISRFGKNDRDFGRVITGSSNFSESGLLDNREFNVELKNKSDVLFALEKFEELWKDAVDLSDEFIETVQSKTWLNDSITPYDLYLKFLYEYFKEDINTDQDFDTYLPEGFIELTYQKQAVLSAKKILDAYNGVFLADVVGLGKTFISALLAQQLTGRILVICPPVLQEYWQETFFDFKIGGFKVASLGKLDQIIEDGVDRFQYIFIDEAHRFRNEVTQSYEKLHRICYGKKVILVSATPLNNTIDDIFSLLKLFQVPRKSTVPGVPNLESFFSALRTKLNQYEKGTPDYIFTLKGVSREVREKVLKHIMVRRTRSEVSKYFEKDLSNQGLSFPELDEPRRIIYKFDSDLESVFQSTIEYIKEFSYARYTPKLYLKKQLTEFEQQSQRNVGGFMKGILVKRLESSFYAFKNTLRRFIESYENFIAMYNQGNVYISQKIDVYDFLDSDNEALLLELHEQNKDKVQKYKSNEFNESFIANLYSDLDLLKRIESLWNKVDDDPKLGQFVKELAENPLLNQQKLIVFTESKETGEYLYSQLNQRFQGEVLFYSSAGAVYDTSDGFSQSARDVIRENFDPKHKTPKDKIRILITTDVLAEGINLHRGNIVINYDLPWNPTRVLQRVGRVNRVGTAHKKIYVFNFFPTDQSDEHLGLEANIKAKIQAFHDILGEDSKYLSEEEQISTHELFGDYLYKKLNDKKALQGEDEEQRSELEYLQLLRNIRDDRPELFHKIKRIPKKARTCRLSPEVTKSHLLTFFRKGKLKKIILTDGRDTKEITFFEAVDLFKCEETTSRKILPRDFYSLIDQNKTHFDWITCEELLPESKAKGQSNQSYITKRLKTKEMRHYKGFTEDDEDYLKQVIRAFEDGVIPKQTSKNLKKAIETEVNPLKVLGIVRNHITADYLYRHHPGKSQMDNSREVILSEYLLKGDKE